MPVTLTKGDFFLIEGVALLGVTTVNGVLWGIAFALYCLCARSSYQQLKNIESHDHQRRSIIITLVYVSLVIVLGLLTLALDSRKAQISYIGHGDHASGGPFAFEFSIAQQLPMNIASNAIALVLDFMTLGVQIWRLWVIWNMSHYATIIIIIPSLLLFAFIGMQMAEMIIIFRHITISRKAHTALPPISQSLNLLTTLIVTLLILARIIKVRQRHVRLLGETQNASQYMTIIAMLIESFALDSLWTLGAIILTSLAGTTEGRPSVEAGGLFVTGSQPFIRIIAYILVIYRVTMGRGWKRETERHLTTLQWNRDGLQTTATVIQPEVSIPVSHERPSIGGQLNTD